jgi:soluble lytic murein transglycosylase
MFSPTKLTTALVMTASAIALGESAHAAPYSQVGTPTSADRAFNDAERTSRSGGDLSSYQQMMQGGALEMYPEYWQLSQYLGSQRPEMIINFVNRYPGSAMAEKLVADYTETKANAGDYEAVRQVASYVTNPDDSEACAIALGFNRGGDVIRGLVEKPNVWLQTNRQPELCRQLASEMNANPMINNTDRDERLYRMLRTGSNGDIVQLSTRLGTPIDYNQLTSVAASPLAFMSNVASLPATPNNRYLYLYALSILAKESIGQAANQLASDIGRAANFFDEKTRAYAYRTLGVARMNVNTDQGFSVDSVNWMRQSMGVPFNFEEAEDYAQAAIRFSQWKDIANAIGAMDYKTQQQPIWRYWLARAYSQSGDANQQQQARQLFTELAQKNDYYGLLAKDQLGQRFDQLPTTATPSSGDYSRLAQDPHFNRAFTLYNISASPVYTNREWNWAVRSARERGDIPLIVAAAQTANDMGWYDRAIYAFESSYNVPNIALAFPMPRQSSVVNYSRQVGIDPAWAYGIMRQESRFNVGAQSHVGAGGLMQIMPETGKYIARKLGEPYSASNVANGDTNIRYGTFYMSDILNKLSGQPVLATAGYNAGPGKARTWQPDNGSLAADQYVDTIPYYETRGYVKAVMENATNYDVLLGGANQSISQRMGVIPPKY